MHKKKGGKKSVKSGYVSKLNKHFKQHKKLQEIPTIVAFDESEMSEVNKKT